MRIFILTALLVILCSSITFSKEEVPPKVEKQLKQALLNSNALGRYFVVAIPPNDLPNNDLQVLAIFVAASEEANVRVSNPNGVIAQVLVPKLGVKSISTTNNLNWNMMLNDNDEEQASDKGIILESDKPISVYVISSKGFTSEGYLAIPVNAWGNEYIHCSFYDFLNVGRNWSTGITVLASEDRTKITLDLKGRGQGLKTLKGRDLGTKINKTLNKGQVFLIQGTGLTQGQFDLTGTIIRGDKPIAIISSHERCMIPALDANNGRDNLLAMPPPVNTWGKNYVSIELDRGMDKGDFFRVVAGEDNTYVDVRWYDKKTGAYIGRWDEVLDKKGDFFEYSKVVTAGNHDNESIRGISYFKSDKPIFVMQYSYSAMWDQTPKGNYDPFMFPVSLVEQFTKATIFQTPSNESGRNEYLDNYLNLIVYADAETEDERRELLKTLKMDNKPLVASHPELMGQKFPALGSPYDDKLYWVTTEPQIGAHTLEGDVSFGGYIYGFANFDSYGWPAATAYRKLGELDTLPPVLEIIEDCGYYEIKATELRNFEAGCDTCRPQIDKGMSQLPTVISIDNFKEARINYTKEIDKDPNNPWYGTPIDYDLNFIYEVIDKKKDAMVHFILPDNTFENFADTTIYYYADKLRLEEVVDFGLKRLYTTNEIKVKLISDKETETIISSMKFKKQGGDYFTVVDPVGEVIIPPKGEIELTLQYIPKREYLDASTFDDGQYDLDSLIIVTECVEFAFPAKGQGGEPYMYVSDWTNETIAINTKSLSSNGGTDKVFIQNYNRQKQRMATFPLHVTGIDSDKIMDENGTLMSIAPFSSVNNIALNVNNDFTTTYTLPHTDIDKRVGLNRGEFESPTTGVFIRDIPFKSNAVNYLIPGGDVLDDTTSRWTRTVLNSSSSITSESWLKERLMRTAADSKGQVNNGTILVENTSTQVDVKNKLTLVDLYITPGSTGLDKLKSSDGAFVINIDPTSNGNNWLQRIIDGNQGNLELFPNGTTGKPFEIGIPFKFTPQSSYAGNSNIVNENIYAVLKNESGILDTLIGNLTGEVYLPIIKTTGEENLNAVLINNLAPYQLQITIENVGYNKPLTIWNIAAPDNADFTFDPVSTGEALPTEASPWNLAVGESKVIYYNFTPSAVGRRIGNVEITHSGNIEGVEPTEDGVNTRQIATETIIAPGRSSGFDVTNLNLEADVKCDNDDGIITVSNSGSDPVTISHLKLSDGTDLNNVNEFVFTFNGGNVNDFIGEVIESGGSRDINVEFRARSLPAGVFNSTVVVDIRGENLNNETQSASSTITGVTDENTVIFTMKKNTNVQDLNPNLILNDSDFNLGISVQLEKADPTWADANITEVTFSIRYKLNWLQPVYKAGSANTLQDIVLKAGSAAPGWNFQVINKELDFNEPSLEWEILTIKGTGNPIPNNGVLVFPYFNVKLPSLNSDSTKLESIEPELIDISFGERDFCIYNVPDKGFVDVQACAAAARTIPITLGQFDNTINQTASAIEMNYAVPFDCEAKIEVVDVNGNVVSIPVSENKGRGFYNVSIPLNKLSSGAHIIRYTAGPLIKTDKIVIVK